MIQLNYVVDTISTLNVLLNEHVAKYNILELLVILNKEMTDKNNGSYKYHVFYGEIIPVMTNAYWSVINAEGVKFLNELFNEFDIDDKHLYSEELQRSYRDLIMAKYKAEKEYEVK